MKPLRIDQPPTPMTVNTAIKHLTMLATLYGAGNQPILVNNRRLVTGSIKDGQVILQTFLDMLNDDPPCKDHKPVTHRDNKPAWCNQCGLTADWRDPQLPHVDYTEYRSEELPTGRLTD